MYRNVNPWKLLSAPKSHVRETSLYIFDISNQVLNSQAFSFGVRLKSGKVKPKRQRGATVDDGGRVVAQGVESRYDSLKISAFSREWNVAEESASGGRMKLRCGL